MSYKRRREDVKRYKRLEKETNNGWPCYAYKHNGHWKRYWKSDGKNSLYASLKKYSRRLSRRIYNRNLGDKTPYSKIYDPYWNLW